MRAEGGDRVHLADSRFAPQPRAPWALPSSSCCDCYLKGWIAENESTARISSAEGTSAPSSSTSRQAVRRRIARMPAIARPATKVAGASSRGPTQTSPGAGRSELRSLSRCFVRVMDRLDRCYRFGQVADIRVDVEQPDVGAYDPGDRDAEPAQRFQRGERLVVRNRQGDRERAGWRSCRTPPRSARAKCSKKTIPPDGASIPCVSPRAASRDASRWLKRPRVPVRDAA